MVLDEWYLHPSDNCLMDMLLLSLNLHHSWPCWAKLKLDFCFRLPLYVSFILQQTQTISVHFSVFFSIKQWMTYTVVIVISANLKIGISRHTSCGHRKTLFQFHSQWLKLQTSLFHKSLSISDKSNILHIRAPAKPWSHYSLQCILKRKHQAALKACTITKHISKINTREVFADL